MCLSKDKIFCKFWDSGWCYHPSVERDPYGCVGLILCNFDRTQKRAVNEQN